jgi:hypothetical protein
MGNTTKNDKTAEIQAFSTGVSSLTDASFVIDSETVTKPQVLQACTAYIAAVAATAAARGQLKTCLDAEAQAWATVSEYRDSIKSLVESRFGKGSPQLLTFGFTPAKPRKISVEAKAAGIAQGKRTRAARHTMGTKQRLEIKAPPVVEPVATAAAPEAGTPTSKA